MTLLGGRYRLEGLLGRGGMGEVYRAVDTVGDQAVAVKVLPAAAGQQHADRLRREAKVAASLRDPVAFSPDGDSLAVSTDNPDGEGGALELVGLDDGDRRELSTHEDDDQTVWSLAFSTGGDRLAAGTLDGVITLWDTESGEQIGEPLTGHIDGVQDIAFQPHGHLLATSGWDNTVRLWDLDTHKQSGPSMTEHTKRPITVSFSADGTRLASAGWDGIPLIWDVANQTVQSALREPGDMQEIRYLADGTLVGTGGKGLITTWDVDPDAALADVCDRLSPLDENEWRQFAADVPYVPQCG